MISIPTPAQWRDQPGKITIWVLDSHILLSPRGMVAVMVEHQLPTCNVRRAAWFPVSRTLLDDYDYDMISLLMGEQLDHHIRPWLYPVPEPTYIHLQPIRDWLRKRHFWR